MNALGIHVYAGGFTLGVKKHFNVIAHLENSTWAKKTIKHNFPDLPVFSKANEWPVEDFSHVDFVYGNPPCKFFSSAGSKKGERLSDKYNRLNPTDHIEFLATSLKIKPKIFVFESVCGILTSGKKMIINFIEKCNYYDYKIYFVIINTKNHGLAQDRKRVFIVASQVIFNSPHIPHKPPTVMEVLSKVENTETVTLNELQQNLLSRLGPNERLCDLFNMFYNKGVKGKPSFFRRRLVSDGLSNTIQTHSDYIHPVEHRLINPAEAAALCGYPSDYEFIGSQNDRFKQIGAAVLPCMGEFIAKHAKYAITVDLPVKDLITETIDIS